MARGLSFFYRRTQLSGRIRRQVADLIGARCNPSSGVEHDICIGVKMSPGLIQHDKLIGREQMGDYYLDFIDHHTCLDWLAHWPETKVIVCSKSGETWLRARLRNPMTFIPQHHCNVEEQLRPERPIKTVAYIGLMTGLPPWYDEVNEAIHKMGMEMRYFTDFQTREDVVNAYLQTDIQFQWCEGMPDKLEHLKNPMRVINGLSFGIPMVSNKLPPYLAECDGKFVGAERIGEAMDAIRLLQTDDAWYGQFRQEGPEFVKPYHISVIAEAFRRLADA